MILFHDVVHVLAWSAFAGVRQYALVFQIAYSPDVSGILVHVDHPRCGNVWSAQYLAEEALGCSGTSVLVQKEIEGLAVRVYCYKEIEGLAVRVYAIDTSATSHLEICFVNAPRIVGLL